MYIGKVHDIANKWNNEYHKTIKMMPVDVKFHVDDQIKISKYKNIFPEDLLQIDLKQFL